jgi:hypothetical protein
MLPLLLGSASDVLLPATASAQNLPGEGRRLDIVGVDLTQDEIARGSVPLAEIRRQGQLVFSSPFNKADGYGDGPGVGPDPTSPGGRPTLQDNGTFLRVNGLDAQTCMECHSVGSNASVPFRFEVGGAGGSNNNAIFQPTLIDVADAQASGFAAFNGRFINPPFLFGSGGVELVAREMTADLQALKGQAQAAPGQTLALVTHGVSFGSISYDATSASFDTSAVEGVDEDLVVRAFGRKGEFATVRGFDVGALQFHLGMQPVEAVGAGVDGDLDGVTDEILIGELSALHVFNTNLEPPTIDSLSLDARRGFNNFMDIGCADCHTPLILTNTRFLDYSFPEVESDPSANVYYSTNLTDTAGFRPGPGGGVRVRMFSDLKRHDMGPNLAESFASGLDAQFITARLWGIADTAPYLHDGRATTLTEAILLHGGEAQNARDAFDALSAIKRIQVLSFLRSLRTPENVADDL